MPVKYICDICGEEIDMNDDGNYGSHNLILKTKNGLHLSIESISLRKIRNSEIDPSLYNEIMKPVLCYKCVMCEVVTCMELAPVYTVIQHEEYPEEDVPF